MLLTLTVLSQAGMIASVGDFLYLHCGDTLDLDAAPSDSFELVVVEPASLVRAGAITVHNESSMGQPTPQLLGMTADQRSVYLLCGAPLMATADPSSIPPLGDWGVRVFSFPACIAEPTAQPATPSVVGATPGSEGPIQRSVSMGGARDPASYLGLQRSLADGGTPFLFPPALRGGAAPSSEPRAVGTERSQLRVWGIVGSQMVNSVQLARRV